ncbi:PHD and RING finger domain-containing protein 1 isoform X2 [Pteronotus mesoamericanus]|uniref:PHD and RING finger domain-containing protein 1 isoform X2 n=1 Tax=Pteronotus mesoamericanus TaxID=1884717 RepID=UPI0023EDB206|nr:PHD and RING finger domain-containing protein 1 isoform X2 [Pteronotus parnellii mesoamericanus]
MDDDSLDELVDQSPGPEAHLPLSAAALAGASGEDDSGGSEDSGSELSTSTDGEDEEGDLEDGSGSEDAAADDADDDAGTVPAADTRGLLEAGGAWDSEDDSESCPICLNTFRDQAVGTPETCSHYFCLDCIVEWSKNATSCPVDRTVFHCICIRARLGGEVLKKVPVENARAGEEEEDPTFCEVCGRSDREDRLLLCDSCDAGYHMECLDPPLQEVPVDEWFCPECAVPGAAAPPTDTDSVTEEEVSLLLADVVPTASRLRPRMGRTRAIARTRQSERVRATVNRNRMSTAQSTQHIPRYLMSSPLDETIEAVVSGLSTAVYPRPVAPLAPAKRRRKARRRRKVRGRKTQSKPAASGRSSGSRSKRRQGRAKRRKGKKIKSEATARCRIARALGLRRPTRGACIPSVYKPADPSLGLMRADIGVAPLSLFGDPSELDPVDSSEELAASPASPLRAKRRVLSHSALRSHQPVARPVSAGLSRRSPPSAVAEPDAGEAPVPDLLGSILSGQSLLLMDGADVTIHRDGSLSAKRAAPISFQRNSVGSSQKGEGPGPRDGPQPPAPNPGRPGRLGSRCQGRPAPSRVPVLTSGAAVRLDSSATPRSGQAQNLSNASGPGLERQDRPHVSGGDKPPAPLRFTSEASHGGSDLPAKSAVPGQAPKLAPRRTDISELPRIPKIRRDGSGRAGSAPAPTGGQPVEIPSSCISRLTGREGPRRPGLGPRAEGEPRGRGAQEPSVHSGAGAQSPAPLGPSRGKGGSSTFESFRINIPGNTAHSSRLSNPGFCHTFRPVENKVQRKENPSPLFSLRKTKQLKSEIYDPFDPTGSDSSSAGSSPERLGSGLLPSEITRTISVGSPRTPPSQTVRCVTSYTVAAAFGGGPEPSWGPPSSGLTLQDEGPAGEPGEEEEAAGSAGDPGPGARAQRPSPSRLEPWEDEDRPPRSTFFGSEERTVMCVAVAEPEAPPTTTHRVVELRPPSRSRSTSSSRGRKTGKRKQAAAREQKRTRSGSRSGSRSGDRSSRSASPPVGEDHAKKHQPKVRGRRSSSDRSSSLERAKRKKAKDRSRERKRESWGRGRRRSRSRSGSPGSSSHEHRESRRRKKRRSGSRSQGRGCSPPSSLERARRPHHPRGRSRERPRDRRGSRERRKHRSRSPSTEHRSREHRWPRSREKRPRPRSRSRSRSPERKGPVREASPAPPAQEEPAPGREQLARPPGAEAWPEGAEADQAPSQAPPVPEVPSECPPEDLDYGDSVEAGHLFEDFSSEGVLTQLDDMSSPPSPESTDSSPERGFPPLPAGPPARQQPDAGLAGPQLKREVLPVPREDSVQPAPWVEAPQEKVPSQQDQAKAFVPGALGGQAAGGAPAGQEEVPCQAAVLRAKAPVKRVTWNLQGAAGGALAADRGLRTPLPRTPQPREEAWGPEDGGPAVDTPQAPCPEPLPPGCRLPEPGFPNADLTQVYSPNLPPALALPASALPYAAASQPPVQLSLQGSLPLAGCGVAPSPAPVPVPAGLTAASEPAGHAVAATNNSEEKSAAPRPAAEKAKNEEYMKKLHMQERAVEEVKLAIKPFYQKREVTKDEYKDILRKAVQKICHSKSGEINPVKVGNLVKAYVDKYRHMRRHRRPEAGEEPTAQGAEG